MKILKSATDQAFECLEALGTRVGKFLMGVASRDWEEDDIGCEACLVEADALKQYVHDLAEDINQVGRSLQLQHIELPSELYYFEYNNRHLRDVIDAAVNPKSYRAK